VPGIIVLMLPWILAAAAQESVSLAIVLRAVAAGITWVAATLGLGAAMLSRAGTAAERKSGKPADPPAAGWQTPTPIAGVAAARRPVPARPEPTAK
jgi:hypothetical protein